MPEVEVRAQGLSRHYQVGAATVLALQDVDMEVERGEFLAVVGVSGSGKSTLLHLIGGLDTPSAGRIEVADRSLQSLTSFERSVYRRQMVGFVFQSFYLVPHLSAEANVRLALTFQGVYGPQRKKRAAEALQQVGLSPRAGHRPGQLSGGEQQRVCVARAMVHHPRLLLVDEPTANLDRKTARELLDLLRRLNRQLQTTVIMVTHDVDLVSEFCDRKIRLEDGRIAQPAGES